jgi:hypothetical protein
VFAEADWPRVLVTRTADLQGWLSLRTVFARIAEFSREPGWVGMDLGRLRASFYLQSLPEHRFLLKNGMT